MLTLVLAFAAGVLSILSPCVLPILPLVLGAALTEHRFGPAALAGGLAVSFVVIGLFVATIGFSIGLDGGVFRAFGAGVMILFGAVLILPSLQVRLAMAGTPLANWGERTFGSRLKPRGLAGQFSVGALLGMVWSPCVGPTLGAASVLAAQGKNLPQVALTMTVFGIGAATPLLVLGAVSRNRLLGMRQRLHSTGKGLKVVLGLALCAIGLAILSGQDKSLETWVLTHAPDWLIRLTTRF
jgi:cytochrome c biogenesis protein CcdA